MTSWSDLPRGRLLADVSLWSADLANLEAAIGRVAPFADSFHIDVSDAHFAPGLLFFPDLVRAMRRHTRVPFHVHLFVERPTELLPDFIDAGADVLTLHAEINEGELARGMDVILRAGRAAGIALRRGTPVAAALPYLDSLSALLLLGTEIGVKGQDLAADACERLAEASHLIRERGAAARLVADGGIRTHTVPLLRRAGADVVVPGSLVFQSGNLSETFRWLHELPGVDR